MSQPLSEAQEAETRARRIRWSQILNNANRPDLAFEAETGLLDPERRVA